MALDKDILGQAIYTVLGQFDNITNDQLIEQYGSMEEFRKALCIALAGSIIDHFKSNAVLTVPGTGMVAGSSPVTGVSTTGKLS